MSQQPPERVINWADASATNFNHWDAYSTEAVVKIVIGASPKQVGGTEPLEIDLNALAEWLPKFGKLTHLYLWNIRGLAALPPLPSGLKCLDVRGCTDLASIAPLPESLETLDLGGCSRLEALPERLPTTLEWVFLDRCPNLKRFQPIEGCLGRLVRLELHGTRFDDLPDFLCGEAQENVAAKVRDHFDAIEMQGAAALPECKIIVLGNGGVGKTCLVRALKGLPYIEQHPFTEGIRLWSWDGGNFLPFPEVSREPVFLNVWDFGGQDLFHNTHRLFLESRAVFVVVWRQPRPDGKPFRDEFPDDPVRPLNYWFDQVFAANPKAQVLVVRTGADEDRELPPEDWRAVVREEYRTLKDFVVSSKPLEHGQLGALREKILGAVQRELRSLEAIRLGRGRRALRERLRVWQPPCPDDDRPTPDSEQPILRIHEFVALAQEIFANEKLGVPAESEVLALLDYLHHCGALYCPPSWRAAAGLQGGFPIIVDQRWAVEGIYRLFSKRLDAREFLKQADGTIRAVSLDEELWGLIEDNPAEPRYDAAAQWVFTQFMVHCGILVELAGTPDDDAQRVLVFPEFLPTLRALMARPAHPDPLLRNTKSDGAARVFRIRHRSLGQGFGCLLVGCLCRLFGRVPLFKYGAVGRVAVDGDERGMQRSESIVRIEWCREKSDAYQGDIVVTVWGDPANDPKVLGYVETQLRKLPGFPEEALLETLTGPLPDDLRRLMHRECLPGRAEFAPVAGRPRVHALERLWVVGLSVAGNDTEYPGIESLPNGLWEELESKADRSFEVLYYKSDVERKMVPLLIDDLVRSDLLLAFVGKKYLHSEYCMVELLEAARHWQKEATFERPVQWPQNLWLLPLADAGELLMRSDRAYGPGDADEAAAEEWKRFWVVRAADFLATATIKFGGRVKADASGPREYVFYPWMKFASESEENLGNVLAAIRNSRHPGWPPTNSGSADPTAWARAAVKELATEVEKRISELAVPLSEADRLEKARTLCVGLWQRGLQDKAIRAFESWLLYHPDPSAARRDLLNPQTPLVAAELRPVRKLWAKWQGVEIKAD
jgi:hypothetical protein